MNHPFVETFEVHVPWSGIFIQGSPRLEAGAVLRQDEQRRSGAIDTGHLHIANIAAGARIGESASGVRLGQIAAPEKIVEYIKENRGISNKEY